MSSRPIDDLLPAAGGRVCLVLLTGIGDVVHGLPLVNALRAARPDLEISWVAEPAPAEILHHHPAVDRIVVYRKKEGLRGLRRLRDDLRSDGRFDLVINAQRYFKSIFPTLFARAPIRVGLSRDKTRDGVSFFNTHHLSDGPWRHTQDILLDFLPLLGLSRPDFLTWGITFSVDEERAAAAYFERFPGPRVGVVVGTANPKKDWPAANYPPLVDTLADRFGHRVFLLGGPSERERLVAEGAVSAARHEPISALTSSVRELMWRIRGMDFIISPDTAPVHIARAMNVPVIGLYGHTNPARVGPYAAFQELVVDRYTDPGSEPDPAGYEPRDGRMNLITPEEVVERVENYEFGIRR
jgi:heptosyltransferase I